MASLVFQLHFIVLHDSKITFAESVKTKTGKCVSPLAVMKEIIAD
jgi:hypothetical protein